MRFLAHLDLWNRTILKNFLFDLSTDNFYIGLPGVMETKPTIKFLLKNVKFVIHISNLTTEQPLHTSLFFWLKVFSFNHNLVLGPSSWYFLLIFFQDNWAFLLRSKLQFAKLTWKLALANLRIMLIKLGVQKITLKPSGCSCQTCNRYQHNPARPLAQLTQMAGMLMLTVRTLA